MQYLISASSFLLFLHTAVHAAVVESNAGPAVLTPKSFAATNFDVIIVGGGTAGLVLANRLSSNPSLSIGVIDAGTYNSSGDPLIDVPNAPNFYINQPTASLLGNPKYDWNMQSVPQAGAGGTVIAYPRGKVLGGSSAINYMVWQRGAKTEYDAWGSVFGNGDTWSFSGLLPYFNRAEKWIAPGTGKDGVNITSTPADYKALSSVQGTSGPIKLDYGKFYSDIDRPLTLASVSLGFPLNSNPDAGDPKYFAEFGIANSVDPVAKKRSYAAPAYYDSSTRARPNLKVLTGALATRLIWDKSTLKKPSIKANGVEFIVGGTKYVVSASKEIILSAGSLKTPQLLELSGIGNSTLLKKLGIPVVLDFPQVGENLMDHLLSVSDFIVNDGVFTFDKLRNNATYAQEQRALYQTSHQGAFTYASKVTGSFPLKSIVPAAQYQSMRAQLDASLAGKTLTPLQNAQYRFIKQMLDQGQIGVGVPVLAPSGGLASTAQDGVSYTSIASYQVHPFSRGSVHITSADPNVYPIIDPKFFEIPFDLQVQVAFAQFVRKLTQAKPLSSLIKSLNSPSANVTTDDQWASYVKSTLGSLRHPMGTTVMASKALGGVVNPRLKVYGLANVRVVDAGVIPMTVGVPIQQTVYGIAEKAASLIAQDLATTKY